MSQSAEAMARPIITKAPMTPPTIAGAFDADAGCAAATGVLVAVVVAVGWRSSGDIEGRSIIVA